jgi:AcrR family transcriptional regulator
MAATRGKARQQDRPLRKDAARNRERILDAAKELFAQRGLGVTLNDIAHHAGVGVGTVYRHFPDKTQLIDRLFERGIEEIAGLAEAAMEDPDPWHGLTSFLEQALEFQAKDRGAKEVMFEAPGAFEHVTHARARMLPLVSKLVARAQASGQLRPDFAAEDMPVVQLMVGSVVDAGRETEPDLWRRYLAIVLQGMRAEPAPPETLKTPAVRTERVAEVLAAWRPSRR